MPNEKITRQDMALILSRVLSKYWAEKPSTVNVDSTKENSQSADPEKKYLKGFCDVDDISSYALNSVSTALKYGLLKGKTNDRIYPLSNTKRAEVAVMLYRLLNLQINKV